MSVVSKKVLQVKEIPSHSGYYLERLPSGRIVAVVMDYISIVKRVEIGQWVKAHNYYLRSDGAVGRVIGFTLDNTDHFVQVIFNEWSIRSPEELKFSEFEVVA